MNSSTKFEKILNSSSIDGKNFTTLLANSKILEKNDTASSVLQGKSNSFYTNKHMRYKRVLTTMKPGESLTEKESTLKKFSRQLLSREISGERFKEILVEQGVNPNAETLNKILRQHELGTPTKFDELYHAIQKFQSDFDPSKMQLNIKAPKFNVESITVHDQFMKSMAPTKAGVGIMYLAAKKPVYSKYNNFNSNKDLFDWEMNQLNMYNTNDGRMKEDAKTDSRRHKIVHESKVFSSDVNEKSSYTPYSTKNSLHAKYNSFAGSGDFLTWKGDVTGSQNWNKNDLSRKNPNEVRNEIVQEKVFKKLNTMQVPSKENTLTINM